MITHLNYKEYLVWFMLYINLFYFLLSTYGKIFNDSLIFLFINLVYLFIYIYLYLLWLFVQQAYIEPFPYSWLRVVYKLK